MDIETDTEIEPLRMMWIQRQKDQGRATDSDMDIESEIGIEQLIVIWIQRQEDQVRAKDSDMDRETERSGQSP